MVFEYYEYDSCGGLEDVIWSGDDLDEARAKVASVRGHHVELFDRVAGVVLISENRYQRRKPR